MARSFEPSVVERGWYEWWHTEARVFGPRSEREGGEERPPFSMLLPPPNVTGALHIGHALTVAAQDSIARWRRMCGDDVLWVPGLDHAGIATQTVVERRLLKEEGLTRHDLGRDEFLRRVWAWRDQYGERITGQVRRLGASLDWSREFFTLDDARSRAVNEAFSRMFEDGVMYRGQRLVNWCPALRTALSDIEVDIKQIEGPTKLSVPAPSGSATAEAAMREVELGWIETFEYAAEGGGPGLRVATTRLETMLGDAAVAVHPEDPRYAALVGKNLVHPLTGRLIPVVADADLVDMDTGTGAVKVTPAHDPNDFECGLRHGLHAAGLFDDSGRLVQSVWPDGGGEVVPGDLVGADRFHARDAVRALLQQRGAYVGREPKSMAVAVCSRSGDVLEPMMRAQWWARADAMAGRAREAVSSGETAVRPASAEAEWQRWLGESRDWCVSRQLWWGHRIPAWRVRRSGGAAAPAPDGPGEAPAVSSALRKWGVFEGEEWVCAADEDEALRIARLAARSEEAQASARAAGLDLSEVACVERDPDVLDTWFSSGLLPLAALGWPADDAAGTPGDLGLSPSLRRFYPMSVLETGQDILFFWVARMVMLCATVPRETSATSPGPLQSPFEQVLLHGMVRDAEGRKMSKSLGNVIDPLAVTDGRPLADMLADVASGNLSAAEAKRAEARILADFPEGIPASGADALRGALLHLMQGQSADVNMDVRRVQSWRLFCNKLWNASRFVLAGVEAQAAPAGATQPAAAAGVGAAGPLGPRHAVLTEDLAAALPLPARWLLHRAAVATADVNTAFATFDLGAGAARAQAFVQADLCDVAIEWCKPSLSVQPAGGETGAPAEASAARREEAAATAAALAVALDAALRLLHPMMPFVTEELWQRLHRTGLEGAMDGQTPTDSLAEAPFPLLPGPYRAGLSVSDCSQGGWSSAGEPASGPSLLRFVDPDLDATMATLTSVVSSARAVTAVAQRVAGAAFRDHPRCVVVACQSEADAAAVRAHERELRAMLRLDASGGALAGELVVVAGEGDAAAARAGVLAQVACAGVSVGVQLPGGSDTRDAVAAEAARLRKRAAQRTSKAQGMQRKLAAPGFAKAPQRVRDDAQRGLEVEQAAAAADEQAALALEVAARA
ncbi:hypothetical protein FNF27_05939 [Cafeteria roenbergensis]|uniref:valine--tRNA ligase n=2 Tax=Cafeteria roenbergensis TaxID=33653 RepID=A0A5A8E482_CAFRO|nr:hypothetical protein FNF27_05939 [Cafeteria roenbergensis]